MLRFILQRDVRHKGTDMRRTSMFTIDADVPALEDALRRIVIELDCFDTTDVVDVEILDDEPIHSEADDELPYG